MFIRDASPADAGEILVIYAPYVEQTAISFEYDVPELEEFRERIVNIQKRFPYLVAVEDGKIIGYCYVGTFHARKAYDQSVETSIYVAQDCRRGGVGRALYEALEERLKAQGIKNLYACIAYPAEENDPHLTRDSVYFHEKLGYTTCGRFHECGIKFDRWYDMVYMEKILVNT